VQGAGFGREEEGECGCGAPGCFDVFAVIVVFAESDEEGFHGGG